MTTVDFKVELKHLYHPPKGFTILDVPPMGFLMGDGHGDPNDNPEFQQISEALYGLAYTIKFLVKAQGKDFVVPPLEGLWWAKDMESFRRQARDRWLWTLMIMQPEWITPQLVEQARDGLSRKGDPPAALGRIRFEMYQEGRAAQTLYIGPYADEGPTIADLYAFIREQGYEPAGKHHEIYLGDPRRTAPEKLKTVIRQPIRRAG